MVWGKFVNYDLGFRRPIPIVIGTAATSVAPTTIPAFAAVTPRCKQSRESVGITCRNSGNFGQI